MKFMAKICDSFAVFVLYVYRMMAKKSKLNPQYSTKNIERKQKKKIIYISVYQECTGCENVYFYTLSLDLRCDQTQHIRLLPQTGMTDVRAVQCASATKATVQRNEKYVQNVQSLMFCPFIISRLFARRMPVSVH